MFGFEGLKRRFTAPRKTARRQSNTRALLRVEQLEDRLVPSGFSDGDFEGLGIQHGIPLGMLCERLYAC